jgi:hypothetical protein
MNVAHAYYTLPGLEMALSEENRRGIGALGERLAAHLLERAGYLVSHTRPGERRGDLRVVDQTTGEIVRVEVKTARRSQDKKWRFTLRKRGHTDHRQSDIVILLAVMPSGRAIPFVVPVHVLRHQNQAVITSHPETYGGKLAVYRQRGEIQLTGEIS